jgi:hypothetical protein
LEGGQIIKINGHHPNSWMLAPKKKLIWAVNKILLSNSLGRKLNNLEETKRIGQRIKSF